MNEMRSVSRWAASVAMASDPAKAPPTASPTMKTRQRTDAIKSFLRALLSTEVSCHPKVQSHNCICDFLFMDPYSKTSNPFVFYFYWTMPIPNESTSQADSKNGWGVKNQAPVPEIRRLGSCSDALLGKMIQRARAYQLKLAHWNAFEFCTIQHIGIALNFAECSKLEQL